MNFVGLDLAWGSLNADKKPNRTGIAVLDASGCLTYVGVIVTDDEIRDSVASYIEGPCVVAIDAPLKVTNQTGKRLAEAELGDDFWPFHARPYPANIERFSDDPRGARLARALGLDIDPNSTSPRRAIEVYPHPATVALFKLGRIFKFKKGSPEERRPEMVKYMEAIESLATSRVPMYAATNANWNRLRHNVKQAQSQGDLNEAEDQIDAVMCAYVALYAERRPDDITIYGDFPANGYILTPTLPPGLKPTPREPMPATITNTATGWLPSSIAVEAQRCASLVTAVQTAWTAIDTKLRVPASIPSHDATDVGGSLSRAAELLELAEQQLRSIRQQLV
jgi:predicted RNase H-like nuclease